MQNRIAITFAPLVVALLFAFASTARAQESPVEAGAQPDPWFAAPVIRERTRPAYALHWQTDLPVLGIGVVLASTRLFRSQPAYCAPLCDRTTLNALDKTTAGFYDTTWSRASDVGLIAVIGATAIYLLGDDGLTPALNDSVVIAESGLTAVAVSSLATAATARPRPFLFGTKAPLDVRTSADAGLSFVSSYTSATFAVAVSTYLTSRRLHPKMSQLVPTLVLITGLASASFVSLGQVEAGNHFITDVGAGAVVGTAAGILVPSLHDTPVRIVPSVTGHEGTVSVMGLF